MTTVTAKIPPTLYKQILRLAEKENISMDELVTRALGSLIEFADLEERAKRGSWEKVQAVLEKVPDVEPEEYDRL